MANPKKQKKKRRFLVLKIILLALLALIIGAGVYVYTVIKKAPAIETLDATPKGYRSSVLDTNGDLVLALSGEESNRVYVKIEEIPADLQRAFVAIEDERFYRHHGVDFRGIIRAFYRGLKKGGNFSEGASTITQQLLKNNVFTEWTEEVTFRDRLERKIQEQYLAYLLERRESKQWILENYLNTINLGGGNWGVATASRYYFNKDVSKLTLSECATLAAITKNPSSFNPLKNPDENRYRREHVLNKMLTLEFISQEEYDQAMADDVYTRIAQEHGLAPNQEVFTYFEDALIYDVLHDLMDELHCTEEEGWNYLYRGGLTIYSTEDDELQQICEEAVNDGELIGNDAQISIVLIDNESGQVRALIGGRGEKDASLLYNRATSSVRQPGSTIKIIGQYAAGIEDGRLTLATAIDDAPHNYFNGTAVNNADGIFHGMTTLRSAIATSDNIVAVKCLQDLGVERTFRSITDFGIATLDQSDKVEALALGGTANGVTNLELTAAYATLARGGNYIEPVYYTKVEDRDGNLLLSNEPEPRRVVKKETAGLLTLAMEDVLTEGTGQDAFFEGVSLAGKSGTSSGAKDVWFVGYSPYITCGAWGGYDENLPQEDTTYVKRLWRTIMERANEGLEDTGFADLTEGFTEAVICTKCGNLAIEGVCDHSEQGDMTKTEVFAPGTEPTMNCTCHEEVRICTVSNERAGRYCPQASTTTRIYLKEGSEGTEDADYVIPEEYTHDCSKHTSIWYQWFHRPTPTPTPAPTPTPTPTPEPEIPEYSGPAWNTVPGDEHGSDWIDPQEPTTVPEEEEEDGGFNFWDWLFGRN